MSSEVRKAHFCHAPFEKIEILSTGDVFLCCPGWLPTAVGNLHKQTFQEIWNGPKALELRASVTDGSFKHCSSQMCPHLQTIDSHGHLPTYSPIDTFANPRSPIPEKATSGPSDVNLAFYLTCNLSCPFCRRETIVFRPGTVEWQQAEKMTNEVITALPQIRRLKLAGNGDPFASRLYWKILTAIDRDLHPHLRVVLHTNGILFNADRWKELSKAHGLIDTVEVSIDAATAETYAMNRRGGSFETLLERLTFISKLRNENSIRRLLLSFVVQTNNFREMPAFIELGRSAKADTIIFSRLNDWGTFPPAIFANRSVHRIEHPLHSEFRGVVSENIFAEPDVFLGNLNEFRTANLTSSPVL